MSARPLLMIPGPIEVSDAVLEALGGPVPGHLAEALIAAFSSAIDRVRKVWLADADHQPFIVAGSGTTAMDMAVGNLLDKGDRVVVVNTGYFSDRIGEMALRRGAVVEHVNAEPGQVPAAEAVEAALAKGDVKALLMTHVDTSTGVRVDVERMAGLARAQGALTVVDGVCSVGAEVIRQSAWGIDVVLTGSQKALGLPPGLGLLVASPRALEVRTKLAVPPALSLDYDSWRPIMEAYEARKPSYFATPATTLIRALDVGLGEVLGQAPGHHQEPDEGAGGAMEARFELHRRSAAAFRAAFRALGLELVPVSDEVAANTISAVRLPSAVEAGAFVGGAKERGVVVAGALHPALKGTSFRVGHMGHVLTRPAELERTVRALAESLGANGASVDVEGAVHTFQDALKSSGGAS